MSDRKRTTSVEDNVCPVCHENIDVYAVGSCNHPTCYRCSVRMRLLCEQMYCPICRADIKQVMFMSKRRKFETIDTQSYCLYQKAMIFSENENIQNSYFELLKHKCTCCKLPQEFDSFSSLKSHISKVHNLMSCKLCTDNLMLFSHERKFYTAKDIVHHKKYGDPNDKSYKGHPLCEFCNERYFDSDALVLHLRKDHFLCHFCEASGQNREFFCEYVNLQDHFRACHFLCEEGECAQVQWSNAFNSEIDFKAHIAQEHSKGLDKSQTRRLKTIDVNFASSSGRGRNRPRNDRMSHAQKNRQEVEASYALSSTIAEVQRLGQVRVVDQDIGQLLIAAQNPTPEHQHNLPLPLETDFPDLQGNLPRPSLADPQQGDSISKGSKEKSRSNRAADSSLANKVAGSLGLSVKSGRLSESEFPSLTSKTLPFLPSSKITKQSTNKNSAWVNPAPSTSNDIKPVRIETVKARDDFPALGKNKKAQERAAKLDFKTSLSSGNLSTMSKEPYVSSTNVSITHDGGTWLNKKGKKQVDEMNTGNMNLTKLTMVKKKVPSNNDSNAATETPIISKIQQLPAVNSLSDLARQYNDWAVASSVTTASVSSTSEARKTNVDIFNAEKNATDNSRNKVEKQQRDNKEEGSGKNKDKTNSTVSFKLALNDRNGKELAGSCSNNGDPSKDKLSKSSKKKSKQPAGKLDIAQSGSKNEIVKKCDNHDMNTKSASDDDKRKVNGNVKNTEVQNVLNSMDIEKPARGNNSKTTLPHTILSSSQTESLSVTTMPTSTSFDLISSDFPSLCKPPPGFLPATTTRGPPPGFRPRTQGPPPGFLQQARSVPQSAAPNAKASSHNPPEFKNKDTDFPVLVSKGPPGFPYRKSTSSLGKSILPSNAWGTMPEISEVEEETPEQRFARLILAERDQSTLESLKLLVLQLNEGIIFTDSFYDSCLRLVGPSTSSLFTALFHDLLTLLRYTKDKAKLMVMHQSRVLANECNWNDDPAPISLSKRVEVPFS